MSAAPSRTDGIRQLYEASRGGDIRKVTELVRSGVDPAARDEKGRTAVHAAAIGGHAGVLRFYAEREITLDTQDFENGKSPLMYAAELGSLSACQFLVEKGARLNAVDDTAGFTPLHFAVKGRHPSIIALLLRAGADTTIRCRDAVDGGSIARGVQDATNALFSALGVPQMASPINEMVQQQLAPISKTAFCYAVQGGDAACVKVFLENGTDPNSMVAKQPALCAAILSSHAGVATVLLEHGADPNKQSEISGSPLCLAVKAGMENVVKLLLAKGANAHVRDKSGYVPLHTVAICPSLPILRLLLEQRVDLDARTMEGQSLLHLAASRGLIAVVQALVAAHANLLSRDNAGETARTHANKKGHALVAAFLTGAMKRKHGSDCLSSDSEGEGDNPCSCPACRDDESRYDPYGYYTHRYCYSSDEHESDEDGNMDDMYPHEFFAHPDRLLGARAGPSISAAARLSPAAAPTVPAAAPTNNATRGRGRGRGRGNAVGAAAASRGRGGRGRGK